MRLCGSPILAGNDQRRHAPEGRQACTFALRNLFGIEALDIAGDQRTHDGMVGLPCLDEADPRPVSASRAPRYLLQHLEGAFGRARVERDLAWPHEEPKLLAAYDALWT